MKAICLKLFFRIILNFLKLKNIFFGEDNVNFIFGAALTTQKGRFSINEKGFIT